VPLNVTRPFTLLRSASVTIRIEPPDLVCVEGAFGARRVRRADIRECSAMLVSYYQSNFDRTYAAPNPDDIIVLLQVEGYAREILGPFPHAEGIAIGDALEISRRDVLGLAANGTPIHVTWSAGVVDVQGKDLETVMRSGEHAMRQAKSRGGDRVFVYEDPSSPPAVTWHLPGGTAAPPGPKPSPQSATRESSASSPDAPIEWCIGICATRGSRIVGAGAAANDSFMVIADGMDSHTGWLGARLTARAVADALATEAAFIAAADLVSDDWGWAGPMQSAADGERVYSTCAADFGDRTKLPRDLDALFTEIDRVIRLIPTHERISSPTVGCIAATFDGTHVRGAHVGIGRALLLRAGAKALQSLVVQHYLHLVHHRSAHPVVGMPPENIPQQVMVNALGMLEYAGVGIDHFDVTLEDGDLLILCSRELDIPDADLSALVNELIAFTPSWELDDIADAIEERAARTYASEPSRASDVAFALARAR
jgi:serine/threonine protein phosphatase PrpC